MIDILILLLIVAVVVMIACKLYQMRKRVSGGMGPVFGGGVGPVLGGTKEFKKADLRLMPIMDPNFNLREVAKQCVLLEEHLNQKAKKCRDCIRKHMITIEGLLEEAVSLDKEHKMTKYLQDLFQQWVKIEQDFINQKKNFEETAQEVRKFRKPILNEHFKDIGKYNI